MKCNSTSEPVELRHRLLGDGEDNQQEFDAQLTTVKSAEPSGGLGVLSPQWEDRSSPNGSLVERNNLIAGVTKLFEARCGGDD